MLFNASPSIPDKRNKTEFYYSIIYDIVDNKRRNSLYQYLLGYGSRVQRSCFEVRIKRNEQALFFQNIRDFYQSDQDDNIIIYEINPRFTQRYSTEEVIYLEDQIFI